jgi:ATP-binding cassette subfamily B protein
MAQQAKVVKMGPGGRARGPRPKIDHPGKLLKRLFSYLFKNYGIHLIIVVVCIFISVLANVQ